MRKAFHMFFNKKYWRIWDIKVWNFNETLTNDVDSFEQPGPDQYLFKVDATKLPRNSGNFLGMQL